jgi:hypothetical protein
MKKIELSEKEAISLIRSIAPYLGYDRTSSPVFPKGRRYVCAVKHTAENGSTYGFDTVYLVWKEPNSAIDYCEIKNSRATKDYIFIESVEINENGSVSVKFVGGDSYSCVPWSESMKVAISGGQAQISKELAQNFAEAAKQAMVETVEHHQHNHPLYQPTAIKESVIDEEREVAVYILFEQIDTDRLTEEGEGWLGDQFRYSLWLIKASQKPKQLYEDHAYIRPWSKSELTGTRGRDCTLKNLQIKGNKINILHPKGERVEEQAWEKLSFKF